MNCFASLKLFVVEVKRDETHYWCAAALSVRLLVFRFDEPRVFRAGQFSNYRSLQACLDAQRRVPLIATASSESTTQTPSSMPSSHANRGCALTAISICSRWDHGFRSATCLVDGDTGWENGVKWRLNDVDTPEIHSPGCSSELQKGLAARDRLQDLMGAGYTIEWLGRTDHYNRQLVHIKLRDHRDAGRVLVGEGLARSWPYDPKAWCQS